MATALVNAADLKDIGPHIRYLSLIGNGLFAFGRYEEAIRYFERALRTARSHPDLGTSVMALTGKARALIELKKYEDARKLPDEALQLARRRDRRGNQAELLLLTADLASRKGHRTEAIRFAQDAAALAAARKFHCPHADVRDARFSIAVSQKRNPRQPDRRGH